MNDMTMEKSVKKPGKKTGSPAGGKAAMKLKEHIVEIISDSGEGAQKCGQSLGAIAAQMGNGIWTTEIIPAEIRPPARSMKAYLGIRDAGLPYVGLDGGTLFGIDTRERNFARVRVA